MVSFICFPFFSFFPTFPGSEIGGVFIVVGWFYSLKDLQCYWDNRVFGEVSYTFHSSCFPALLCVKAERNELSVSSLHIETSVRGCRCQWSNGCLMM